MLGRQLSVRVDSKDLDEILPAAGIATTGPEAVPIHLHNGEAVFTGTVTGKLEAPQIAGHASATNFTYDQRPFDSFAADIVASPAGVQAHGASLARGGLRLQFQGSVALAEWKTADSSAISASASLANANLADLLAMANQKDVPVSGSLTASAQVSGTIGSPDIAADLHLLKGQLEGEPFDRLDAKVTSRGDLVEVSDGRLAAGARLITASATYNHAARDFGSGRVQFQVSSNALPLDQFQFVVKDRPGVKGTVQLSASGAAGVTQKAGQPAIQMADLRADITAHGLALDDRTLGDAHLTATTEGQAVRMHLDSNIAGSALTGDGRWQLTGDYPGSAQVQFSSLDFARLRDWLTPPKAPGGVTQFAGSAQGSVTVDGPLLQPELWKASLDVPQFQLQPASGKLAARRNALTLRNAEP